MATGGRNMGRVGVITHRERHDGGFNIVHIKDAIDNEFATRESNVFVIGREKPWISLPKGKGVKVCIIRSWLVIQELLTSFIAVHCRGARPPQGLRSRWPVNGSPRLGFEPTWWKASRGLRDDKKMSSLQQQMWLQKGVKEGAGIFECLWPFFSEVAKEHTSCSSMKRKDTNLS